MLLFSAVAMSILITWVCTAVLSRIVGSLKVSHSLFHYPEDQCIIGSLEQLLVPIAAGISTAFSFSDGLWAALGETAFIACVAFVITHLLGAVVLLCILSHQSSRLKEFAKVVYRFYHLPEILLIKLFHAYPEHDNDEEHDRENE